MFVNLLNAEQKKYFGTLIELIVNVDHEVSEGEIEIVEGYKKELGVEKLEIVTNDINEVVNNFKDASETVKNAVYFEVVTVILADEVIKKEESELIDKIALAFGFDAMKKSKFLETAKSLQHVYGEVFELVY